MPRSRLFFLSMSVAAAFCGISSATVWENHLWIRSCYLPHLYNAEQSFCPERMIDRYANRYMSVARGVLPADERVLRHRRIRAGARAQEPNRHGRRREAPRRRGRPRRDHAHQRLPVGLPARHHAGIAGHRLVGRAGRVRRSGGTATVLGLPRGDGIPHLRGRRLLHRDHPARGGRRAHSEILRHLRHREVRPAHRRPPARVLPHHLPDHGHLQRHHQRGHAPVRP